MQKLHRQWAMSDTVLRCRFHLTNLFKKRTDDLRVISYIHRLLHHTSLSLSLQPPLPSLSFHPKWLSFLPLSSLAPFCLNYCLFLRCFRFDPHKVGTKLSIAISIISRSVSINNSQALQASLFYIINRLFEILRYNSVLSGTVSTNHPAPWCGA